MMICVGTLLIYWRGERLLCWWGQTREGYFCNFLCHPHYNGYRHDTRLSLIRIINILSITFLSLDQGLAKLFSKEPESKYFIFCGPQMVSSFSSSSSSSFIYF